MLAKARHLEQQEKAQRAAQPQEQICLILDINKHRRLNLQLRSGSKQGAWGGAETTAKPLHREVGGRERGTEHHLDRFLN